VTILQIGIGMFLVGFVMFTIGSVIAMAYNPREFNEMNSTVFHLTGSRKDKAQNAWTKAMLTHPKSRWWIGIGFLLFLAGMAVLFFSQ
jgi:uncharacterized membrane protein